MPDKDVKTILDLIYYQYAKLIARSAFKIPDGDDEITVLDINFNQG